MGAGLCLTITCNPIEPLVVFVHCCVCALGGGGSALGFSFCVEFFLFKIID